MRWEALFADLEAQADALVGAERDIEIEERTRANIAQLSMLDRFRPAAGLIVNLRCLGGATVAGRVQHVNPECLLIAEASGREAVVALAMVTAVSGLSRLSAVPDTMGQVESRLGLRHALRGIARHAAGIRTHRCPH